MALSGFSQLLGSPSFLLALTYVAAAASCSPAANDRAGNASTGGSISVSTSPQGGSNGSNAGGTGSGINIGIGSTGNTIGLSASALCQKYGGIACQIQDCTDQPKTSITAKVYDPAGKVPLYNVVLYVPSAPVDPIPDGVTCDNCSTPVSGKPIASALTDAQGQFKMDNMPVGKDIPVVIQIGKWRREIKIPEVKACQDNAFSDAELFRLPRNQSEGHIPKIAIAAGDADRLQCIFRRIGIDTAEFTNPDGAGRINIYNQPADPDQGGGYDSGGTYPPVVPMWEDINQLKKYDMLLLACGGVNSATNPTKDSNFITNTAKANMVQYVNQGGRVFGEHYHWSWIRTFTNDDGVPFPTPFGTEVATWIEPISTSAIGTAVATTIDTSYPKGKDFADWLLATGASTTLGKLTLTGEVKPTALDHLPPTSQRWIYEPVSGDTGPALRTHYFTFNTPIGQPANQQCGRFVYTGLHVTTSDTAAADSKTKFPSQCKVRDLLPQEKAIEFMIFDMSSCVSPPDVKQEAPSILL